MREKEVCTGCGEQYSIIYPLFMTVINMNSHSLVFLCNETACIMNVWIYLRLFLVYILLLFIDISLVLRQTL